MPAPNERIARLIRIIHIVKFQPRQSRKELLATLGISQTRFQQDRKILAGMGFRFEWKAGNSQTEPTIIIVEDTLAGELGLSVTEGLITILALRQMRDSGDSFIAEHASAASTKLSRLLPQSFDDSISAASAISIATGYGCAEEVVESLKTSLQQKRMIRIHYKSMNSGGTLSWRMVEPLRLHMAGSNLYLFGREFDLDKEPKRAIKTYLVRRIAKLELTDMLCDDQTDGAFDLNRNNAFRFFMGEETESVTIRFSGLAVEYIRERVWHQSQRLKSERNSLLFTVDVANPREVLRWSMTFWPNAEIITPSWLRREALETAQAMGETLSLTV